MHKTRAIRLSHDENQRIEQFLKLNPFLDFSTLTRLAISNFIEKPELSLKPLPGLTAKKTKVQKYETN